MYRLCIAALLMIIMDNPVLTNFLNSFRNCSNAGSHKLKIWPQFGKALPAIFDANGVSCLPTYMSGGSKNF